MNDRWNPDMNDDMGLGTDDLVAYGATITLVRDTFAEDAATVRATADAWRRYEVARSASSRSGRRAGIPVVAAAVAATVAILAGVLLRPSGTQLDTQTPATTPPASATTVPDAPVVGAVDPSSTAASTSTSMAPTSVPRNRSVRDVDLYNASYPAALCPGVHTTSIDLHDGEGGDPEVNGNDAQRGALLRHDPGTAAYGDVDGDGVEDVAVIIDCHWWRTDDHASAVAVMTMANGSFVPRTVVVDPLVRQQMTYPTVTDDRSPVVSNPMPLTYRIATHVQVDGGRLSVTWTTYEMGGVNHRTTAIYRVDRGPAELVSATDPEVIDGQEYLEMNAQRYAVRSVDLRSMVLPLSTGGICSTELGAAGSVRDARLNDGRSTVLDQNGNEVGGVEIVDVTYGRTPALDSSHHDSDGAYVILTDEALVRLRCTGPSGTRVTYIVVGLRDGSPVVLGELVSGDPSPAVGVNFNGASAESAVVIDAGTDPDYQGSIEIQWFRRENGSDTSIRFFNHYRWNGSSFDRF